MRMFHDRKKGSTMNIQVDQNNGIILGFDIGGTKTAIVLGTTAGEIFGRVETPTNISAPFSTSFDEIVSTADCFLDEKQCFQYKPQLISVSIGGPLDIDRGIIFSPPHLPNWDNVCLKDRLADHYHLPVYIEQSANEVLRKALKGEVKHQEITIAVGKEISYKQKGDLEALYKEQFVLS